MVDVKGRKESFMPSVIALIVLVICFVLYNLFENKNLATTNYLIEQSQVPEEFSGMRFVCLSDLHLNQFGKGNKKLIKQIHACNPDAILIAGDMITISRVKNAKVAMDLLQELSKDYVIYYAPGNHEYRWESYPKYDNQSFIEYKKRLENSGIQYLNNSDVTIKKGNALLQIVGLNLNMDYYNKGGKPKQLTKDTLQSLIHHKDSKAYTILLAHVPDYFEQYVEWGAELVLSGHNHGGMIRLGKLGGVISPRYELFPKYDSGVYKKNGSVMLLSRGLGTHTIPIRMFNRPELICFQIKKKCK